MSIKSKFQTLFSVEDEEYYEEIQPQRNEEIDFPTRSEKRSKREDKNVVSLKSVQPQTKVVLSEPRSYEETQDIADNIVNHRAVVINLQRVYYEQEIRLVANVRRPCYVVASDIQ